MEIAKKKTKGRWNILIDEKKYTTKEAAKYFSVSIPKIARMCQHLNNDQFYFELMDCHWKKENKISSYEKVHRAAGKRFTTTTVMRATGICESAATMRIVKFHENIRAGVSEEQAYYNLIKPIKNKRKYYSDQLEIRKRKNPDDIPGPGSWENKHLNPTQVPNGSSGPSYGFGY